MTLAVAEALNTNKPKPKTCMCLSPRIPAAIRLKAHIHSAPRRQGQTPSSGPGGRTGQRGLQLYV